MSALALFSSRRVLGACAVSFMLGCNTATLHEVGDGGTATCTQHGIAFCDAGAPGTPGCLGDANDPNTKYLPPTTAMPLGCKANIVADHTDSSGVCALLASCVCTAADASSPAWVCAP